MTRLLPLLALLCASAAPATPTFTVRILDDRTVDTGRPDARPLQCPDAQGNPGPCSLPMSKGVKTDWAPYEPTTDPAAVVRLLEVATWTLSSSGAVSVPQTWPVQLKYRAFPFGDLARMPMCTAGPIYFDFTPDLRLRVVMYDPERC